MKRTISKLNIILNDAKSGNSKLVVDRLNSLIRELEFDSYNNFDSTITRLSK